MPCGTAPSSARARGWLRSSRDGGLDQPVAAHDAEGNHANLRRLLCDLVEEYGRHTGHADLIREAVDGRVGEDPPAGWTPSRPAGRRGRDSLTGQAVVAVGSTARVG